MYAFGAPLLRRANHDVASRLCGRESAVGRKPDSHFLVDAGQPQRLRMQHHRELGVGEATQNAKVLDPAVNELGQITGQKPVVTRAKKSIAAFKVRENMPIGCMVTLRGDRMYEFLDRLMNVALPRVRDFRGVSPKSFDGRGNYTLGLRDQLIFPEIDYNKVEKVKGMNVSITTTAKTDAEGLALLRQMGMPFRQ